MSVFQHFNLSTSPAVFNPATGRSALEGPLYLERPNAHRSCLAIDYSRWCSIVAAGGLLRLCCPAAYSGDNPPWIVMPPEGRRFQEIGTTAIVSSLVEGTEISVHSFRVPSGYDGVIVAHFQAFQGTPGLIEGSGDITWRISANRRFIKDYSSMTTSLGSFSGPNPLYRGGIRLVANQTIDYRVVLGAGSQGRLDPNGRISVGIMGWYYPINR